MAEAYARRPKYGLNAALGGVAELMAEATRTTITGMEGSIGRFKV